MKRLLWKTVAIWVGVASVLFLSYSCSNTSMEASNPQSKPSTQVQKPITASAPELAIRTPPPAPAAAPAPHRVPSIVDEPRAISTPASSESSRTYVSYKSFLTSGEPITTRPYSFVYFGKPPTTTKLKQQYILICQMYLDTFSEKEETETYFNPNTEKLIPVFWFSKKKRDDKGCEALIKDYDYQRARSLINQRVSAPPTPSLVARFGNYSIVMELNGLDNQEDLDMAFSTWKDKITRFPEKDYDMTVISLVYSAKKVLGVFGQILYYTKS